VIGDRLTEINVTSPTCFVEITQQTGFDVAAHVHRRPGTGMRRLKAALAGCSLAACCCSLPAARAPRSTSGSLCLRHPRRGARCGLRIADRPRRRRWPPCCRVRPPAPHAARLAAFRTDRPQRAPSPAASATSPYPRLTFIHRGAGHRRASDQLFNPAIGRLVALWGFHTDEFKPLLPAAAAARGAGEGAAAHADLAIIAATASEPQPAVQLDLGGYAKGYALDRAAAILRAGRAANALINIGGNVMALGRQGRQPWRVGIQHPRAAAPLATLELRDGEAIGTSGDYQRYFELDGRRYCHLLDPRSGRPAEGTQAVTVLITPSGGAPARCRTRPASRSSSPGRRMARPGAAPRRDARAADRRRGRDARSRRPRRCSGLQCSHPT
jgi:hypothetical protein